MQQDDVDAGEHNLQRENKNELKFYTELESYFLRGEYPSGATKAEKGIYNTKRIEEVSASR